MSQSVAQAYSGIDNLETLKIAHNYNRFLMREVSKASKKASKALDFGAGLGNFSAHLRERGLSVQTVETDPSLQQKLRQEGFEVCASLDAFSDGQFDFVCTLNVLEHIDDDAAILAGFHRVLKPGGSLYIYVPAFELLWSSMDDKVGHLRRYTRSMLHQRLEAANFKIERSRYRDAIGFFVTLAFKALGNKQGDVDPRSLMIYDRFLFPFNALLDRICGLFLGKNVQVTAFRD